MSEAWFYTPELSRSGEHIALDRDEAKHAAGARRLVPGDAVTLFDGLGLVADAVIEPVHRRGTFMARTGARRLVEPQRPQVRLATALPRGDRLATMLSMATQLGVSSITPVAWERGMVRRPAGRDTGARWRRILVEACKQSRRAHVPRVEEAAAPPDVLAAARLNGAVALLADPRGMAILSALQDVHPEVEEILLLVGPEGGLTEREREMIIATGARPASLGDGILRIETAAVAVVAAMAIWFDAARRPVQS
jgi:16S rRNA (uracil1498-N3)-methyltransferase